MRRAKLLSQLQCRRVYLDSLSNAISNILHAQHHCIGSTTTLMHSNGQSTSSNSRMYKAFAPPIDLSKLKTLGNQALKRPPTNIIPAWKRVHLPQITKMKKFPHRALESDPFAVIKGSLSRACRVNVNTLDRCSNRCLKTEREPVDSPLHYSKYLAMVGTWLAALPKAKAASKR